MCENVSGPGAAHSSGSSNSYITAADGSKAVGGTGDISCIKVEVVKVPERIRAAIRHSLKYGKKAPQTPMDMDEFCGQPKGSYKKFVEAFRKFLP